MRSSCTLGLNTSEVDGKISASRKPIYFLNKGCKGSRSVALLKNCNKESYMKRAPNDNCESLA